MQIVKKSEYKTLNYNQEPAITACKNTANKYMYKKNN